MKRKLCLTLLSVCTFCCVQSAFSQQISEEEAKSKALSFLNSSAAKSRIGVQNASLKLAYVAKQDSENHFYVFNSSVSNGGFVIVGADEVAGEILGYCPNGNFDYSTAPDNFKWWLSQYSCQIHKAISDVKNGKAIVMDEPSRQLKAKRKMAAKSDIPFLVKTQWNQSTPYNNSVNAAFNEVVEGNFGLVTGCVATAMAQVMNYYKWPDTGVGSAQCTTKNYKINEKTYSFTPSANFGQTTYDWDNMLDSYSNNYTSSQAEAVATLMYHCGVSVNMDYGTSSGADSQKLPYALMTYFKYNKGTYYTERDYYTDDEWDELIFGELSAGRPVLYGGQAANGGGHEFICDGYSIQNSAYHFNWGWGGYCDGYYPLQGTGALQPNGNGIGGAGTGSAYTIGQDAVINLKPVKQGEDEGTAKLNIVNRGNYYLTDASGTTINSFSMDRRVDQDVYLTINLIPYNLSASSATFDYGAMFIRKDDGSGIIKSFSVKGGTSTLGSRYYGSRTANVNTNLFTDGEWEVFPAFKDPNSSQWEKMPYVLEGQTIPTITIQSSGEIVKKDVDFMISGTKIKEGKTVNITYPANYTGQITYTSTDNKVVTVSAGGVVTAVGIGTATITAHAESTDYYNETDASFEITVISNAPDLTIAEQPVAGINNYVSPKHNTIPVKIHNETNSTISPAWVYAKIIVKYSSGGYNWTRTYMSGKGIYVGGGKTSTATITLDNELEYCIPNQQYTVNFYTDEDYTEPYTPYSSVTFTYVNDIDYTFKMTTAGYGTLCLPFDAEIPDGLEAYECENYNNNGYITLSKAETLTKNTPYIMKGTAGEYNFQGQDLSGGIQTAQKGLLVGVLSNNYLLNKGLFVLQNHASTGLGFYVVGETRYNTPAKQYSCLLELPSYIDMNGNEVHTNLNSLLLPTEEEATNIKSVESDEDTNISAIYNINGTRMQELQKGVNIIRMSNGSVKKVFVK